MRGFSGIGFKGEDLGQLIRKLDAMDGEGLEEEERDEDGEKPKTIAA
jgi:hypothetical protein